ncbi:hypothetical protein HAALTHF_48410n [Vreelandella aquamarina]|nr:hypothetical protein HAALTHF_48410n [Halomonas axialensis]
MYKLAFLFPLKVLKALKTPYSKPARGGLAITNTPAFKRVVLASFVPLDGAEPHIGQIGKLETVEEFKVELVCADEHIQAAIAALKLAHPYEEVAYDVWQLADL